MSLYGINAYTSNSYYSALLSGKNQSLANSISTFNKNASKGSDLSSMLSDALKTDSNDLYSLAKKAALVKSPSYQKELIEGFKEYFSGGSTATDAEKVESTQKLSENSKLLSGYAGALSLNGQKIFKDPDQTAAAINDFVESYNNTIDGLKNADNATAMQKGVTLVNTTKAYARTLNRIGISVGSDNKLTVDEDKLKKAPEATLKSLFTGSYSLANKIADKASYINRAVNLSSLSYNAKGSKTDYYNQLSAMMFGSKV